jgi:hypothetical protein
MVDLGSVAHVCLARHGAGATAAQLARHLFGGLPVDVHDRNGVLQLCQVETDGTPHTGCSSGDDGDGHHVLPSFG